MMGWTKRKQSLYDKMAGCLVVRNSSPSLSVAEASADKAVRKQPTFESKADLATDTFKAEALRKYKAGEIDEDTMMNLLKTTSR